MSCRDLQKSGIDQPLIVLFSFGGVSVICCVLAVGLVFCLKLHKNFMYSQYRLVMYQVLASMLVSLNSVLDIILNKKVWRDDETFNKAFIEICDLTAFLLLYFEWIKLLFTTMLSFHLFCLAVCLKDFKHYEKEYIVISVCLPALFVWIPFKKNYFGSVGPWCWIRNECDQNHAGAAEQILLWYGPCIVLLLLCTIVAVAVIVVLLWCRHNNKNHSNERETLLNQESDKNKNALIEISPLLIYPTIYISLQIVTMYQYNAKFKKWNFELVITNAVINGSWGILESMALFTHIMISKYLKKKQKKVNLARNSNFTELHVRTGEDRLQMLTSYTEVTTDARTELASSYPQRARWRMRLGLGMRLRNGMRLRVGMRPRLKGFSD